MYLILTGPILVSFDPQCLARAFCLLPVKKIKPIFSNVKELLTVNTGNLVMVALIKIISTLQNAGNS